MCNQVTHQKGGLTVMMMDLKRKLMKLYFSLENWVEKHLNNNFVLNLLWLFLLIFCILRENPLGVIICSVILFRRVILKKDDFK